MLHLKSKPQVTCDLFKKVESKARIIQTIIFDDYKHFM